MATDSRFLYSLRSSTLFSVLTVGLGMLCDSFLYAFVVPLLPSFLEHRTQIPPQDIQKAISITLAAFALAASLGSPFAGLIADRYRYRSVPFLAGLVFLAAGTAMFMTVQTFPLLVVARVLQGLSTAVVWTVGLAILLDKVGAARMGVTMGSIFGVMGATQLAAPTLGGWLYEKAGMKPLAAISLGIIILDFSMRVAVIEEVDTEVASTGNSSSVNSNTQGTASRDIPPDHHLATAQTQDTEHTALLTTDKFRYPLPKSISSYAASFPVLILIQDPRLIAAQVVTFTQAFQFSAIDATLPPELATRLGFSPGLISLMILPWIVPFIIFDPIFGRVVDRIGTKIPALAGLTAWAIILSLIRIPIVIIERGNQNLGLGVWAGLLVLNGMAAAGVGSGGIVAAGKVAEGYVEEHPDVMIRKGGKGPYAQLFSINSIVFHCGLAAGPAAAGALRISIGYANMNIVLAVLVALTGVVVYIYMDGRPAFGRGYEQHTATGNEEEEDDDDDDDDPLHTESST